MSERYNNFSIELDCPPGNPRPNDLIAGVIQDSGIEVEDFETSAPFFGHQTWVLKSSAEKDELFTKNKPVFKQRIGELYEQGLIRYGSW